MPVPAPAAPALALSVLLACSGGHGSVVAVDGSSSLYPLSEAVAEAYQDDRPGARVTVALSGSGSGLRQLCAGTIDVAGASRPLSADEARLCRARGLHPLALLVARDGVALVVNARNADVACLTLDELGRLWHPDSRVTTWRDLRPGLPSARVRLLGPGSGSATFHFFTTEVVGQRGLSRADYHHTENDFLIARGVAGHRWALGYFGSAYVAGGRNHIRALEVDTGFGCVFPTPKAVTDGRYGPLVRDLYIYVTGTSLARPSVLSFVSYYVDRAGLIGAELGYGALSADEYVRGRALLAGARAGQHR